jgi:hypothetical protein
VWPARFPIVGALASILLLHGVVASAGTRPPGGHRGGPSSLYKESRGIVGLGFGWGPWWGPYDAFAPPAYAYPPPIYSIPPPGGPGSPAHSRRGACRQFQSTVIVDGQARVAKGLACPQPDGSWRIVQ